MNHPAKKLCQQRAMLTARQGDPQAPASGTLYARRQRLANQLEAIELEEAVLTHSNVRVATRSMATIGAFRSSSEVQRELAAVDSEIEDVQKQIDAIDRQLVRSERKH
jgi:hypothetical protein